MKARHMLLVICLIVGMLAISSSGWAVPYLINYQGRLTDKDGNPLDGTMTMKFYLYDSETGGSELWSEVQDVNVVDGIYNVLLGSVTDLSPDIFSHDVLYLAIDIYNDDTSSWETMSPRQRITSTAFAIKAGDAETLKGYLFSDFAPAEHQHSAADITAGTLADARIPESIARDSEITWNNLSGIPSGFADGTDDGILEETDPTVESSVKDGVSWSEIQEMPDGFKDGVDNDSGGDITEVIAGTGLKGGGSTGSVTIEADVPFELEGSLAGTEESSKYAIISGINTSQADWEYYSFGGYFEAQGEDGKGVYGLGSKTGDVHNYGGYFEARGDWGYGVYAFAPYRGVFGSATGDSGFVVGVYGLASSDDDVTNYGGYFTAQGLKGRAVYGIASKTGGNNLNYNYGGYFVAKSDYGRGVYGEARSENEVTNYGGYFVAKGKNGRGVYGSATGSNGYGMYGVGKQYGVYGLASGTTGENYGGYFWAHGYQGKGVYGYADGGDGTGVYGYASALISEATKNYGGYFLADGRGGTGVYGEATDYLDVENYGGHFVARGESGIGVYGFAGYDSTTAKNIGGSFEAAGGKGYGVKAVATGTESFGVYAEAQGEKGRAVYGVASNESEYHSNFGGYFVNHSYRGAGVYAEAASDKSTEINAGGYFVSKSNQGRGVIAKAETSSGIGVWASGGNWDFYAYGTYGGSKYGPFTGAHDVKLAPEFPRDVKPGMIVCITGATEARTDNEGKVSISSTLPTVILAVKANDKAVFGAFAFEYSLPKDHWYKPKEGERFGAVNALGEGRVWVSNLNGNIEAGDYITTSPIPGYGQKQDDDILHSYTLGKAIETVDWESVTETVEYEGREVKVYLIAVVYTSG